MWLLFNFQESDVFKLTGDCRLLLLGTVPPLLFIITCARVYTDKDENGQLSSSPSSLVGMQCGASTDEIQRTSSLHPFTCTPFHDSGE